MALTLAPDGAVAISPWREPWELKLNETQAPDGATVNRAENVSTLAVTSSGFFIFLPIKPPVNAKG